LLAPFKSKSTFSEFLLLEMKTLETFSVEVIIVITKNHTKTAKNKIAKNVRTFSEFFLKKFVILNYLK